MLLLLLLFVTVVAVVITVVVVVVVVVAVGRNSVVGINALRAGSNPGGGEIFRTRPDRSWGHLALCTTGTASLSRG